MTDRPERRKPGPKPRPGGPLKPRLTIKASATWDLWLDTFAVRLHLERTALIDRALAELARIEDFPPPPPRG